MRRLAGLSFTAAVLVTGGGASGSASEISLPASPPPRLGSCGSAGGFRLPDIDGCLTIGGFVRAEGFWSSLPQAIAVATPRLGPPAAATMPGRDLGRTSFGTSARLTADMHIPTELGPFRVFVSLRGHNGTATDRLAR